MSTVTGQFNQFTGTVETTGKGLDHDRYQFYQHQHEQRDAHLKNGDFFDAENHPQLVLESGRIEKKDEENYNIHGTLTMRGVSKEISLDAGSGDVITDAWGNTRVGFSPSGKINRKDFGFSFNITDAGGIGLGEEVKLLINAQFVKQPA